MKLLRISAIVLLLSFASLYAQQPSETPVEQTEPITTIKVNVVSHTTKAINYQYRSGATIVKFGGTSLMPKAKGQAKVESKQGYIEIEVEFEGIPPASTFGSSYLTYVLWAITPEGSATNLGELVLTNGRSKVNVTTRYQSFAMVVTAEPHFAVRMPSELLVMDNTPAYGVKGAVNTVDAKFELLSKTAYPPLQGTLIKPNEKDVPLFILEARNAIRIATETGAAKYAADVYEKAQKSLAQAEGYQVRKDAKKATSMIAREAAQHAEDARAITVVRIEEERIAKEKADAAARQAAAEAREAEARQRELQAKLEAETEARKRAEADANRARAEEAARREAADRAAADEARKRAEARAEDEARRAEEAKRQAELEKAALRMKLFEQFSRILETRDTERGLVVNMSDVLFDFGKYSLRPITREKLARVAGILLNYPDLMIDAEGHTDNVGSDEFNQSLSEKRASTVIEFLRTQGISDTSLTAKGLGKAVPVVPNTTAKNRQQNRRVELVISGEVIGHNIADRPAPSQPTQ
jgi:outer membrane protein OmpA-like peptidoglycan-associated protein